MDIVSSGSGKQEPGRLGEFYTERADVDALECLSKTCLTGGSPPYLPDYPGVGQNLLLGLVRNGEAWQLR